MEFPAQEEPRQPPPEPAGYRLPLVCLLAAGIGVLTAFIAYGLYSLIGLFTNLAYYHEWSFHFRSPRNSSLGWWMILIPVVGGVLIGLMAKFGSEKIRGHGIPEAMEAVLTSRSRIEAKVAFLKPLSAAIGIGTGGPFGAEGPIIQTGGAFGSLVGQFISTTAAERKVMLACGGGAGLAATFNAPITGVLLALELLLFEFRTRSFIPVVISCTMAVAIRRLLFGGGAMFEIGTVNYNFLPGFTVLHRARLAVRLRRRCVHAHPGKTGRIFRPSEDRPEFSASRGWSAGPGYRGILLSARAGLRLRHD